MTIGNEQIYDGILTALSTSDRPQFLIQPTSVYNFFTQHNLRKIPDYQRPYSWKKQHILALLNDIFKIANEERDSWFLGPIFTTKIRPNDEVSELLDGQQRVTTIQIILRESSVFKKRIQDLVSDWAKN